MRLTPTAFMAATCMLTTQVADAAPPKGLTCRPVGAMMCAPDSCDAFPIPGGFQPDPTGQQKSIMLPAGTGPMKVCWDNTCSTLTVRQAFPSGPGKVLYGDGTIYLAKENGKPLAEKVQFSVFLDRPISGTQYFRLTAYPADDDYYVITGDCGFSRKWHSKHRSR